MKTLSEKFKNKKLFSSQFFQLFLFGLALVFVNSSCTYTLGTPDPEEPELSSNTVFYSPVNNPIYYVDVAGQNGESIGPETVIIQADITANKAIKSLSVEIRNSSYQLVYTEPFDGAIGDFGFSIDMTFLTNVVDIYSVFVVSSYGDGSSSSIVSSSAAIFEYRNPISDGGEN